MGERGQPALEPMRLKKGERYYIEALLISRGVADHLSVGWRRPGAEVIEVIAGEFLSPVRAKTLGGKAVELAHAEAAARRSAGAAARRSRRTRETRSRRLEHLDSLRGHVSVLLQARLAAAVRDSSLAYFESKR